MDFSRDLFLSEFIINYLQTTYPNIYSDVEIIRKYIEYKKLKELEYSGTLPDNEKEKLQELNVYFYGNSDGSSSGETGYNLINMYRTTIDIIENLINKNDESVKDIVTGLVDLVQVDMKNDTDNSAFKKYLNELIIPSLFKENPITQAQADETLTKIPETNYKFKEDPIRNITSTIQQEEKKTQKKEQEDERKVNLRAIQEARAKDEAERLREKRKQQQKDDEEDEGEVEEEGEENDGNRNKSKSKKVIEKTTEEEEEQDNEGNEDVEENKKEDVELKESNFNKGDFYFITDDKSNTGGPAGDGEDNGEGDDEGEGIDDDQDNGEGEDGRSVQHYNGQGHGDGHSHGDGHGLDYRPSDGNGNGIGIGLFPPNRTGDGTGDGTGPIRNDAYIRYPQREHDYDDGGDEDDDEDDDDYDDGGDEDDDELNHQFGDNSSYRPYDSYGPHSPTRDPNSDPNSGTNGPSGTYYHRDPSDPSGTYGPRSGTYDPRSGPSGTYDPRYGPRSGIYDPRSGPRSGTYDPLSGTRDTSSDVSEYYNSSENSSYNGRHNGRNHGAQLIGEVGNLIQPSPEFIRNGIAYDRRDRKGNRFLPFKIFDDPQKGGGKSDNLKDFDAIYDKISDLELIKKINNKQLIFLLLNTNAFSSLITKDKSENVLKRYAESILLTIFKTIKQNTIYFIKHDILLSSHFDIKEIIYYNFINFLYLHYDEIYDFKEKEVIIELLNDNYRYSKKYSDDYLLRFIYEYSKNQNVSKLLGYDSFKTYMFLNSYGKLHDTVKLNKKSYDISKSKSLNLYNFVDLKREFTIYLTDIQLKECIKDLSKISKSDDKTKQVFVINDKILDKICIYSDNIFKKKNLPIINFNNYLEKKSNKSLKDFNNTYSILYLSSFLFRNNKEISSKIYCELINCYIDIKKSDKNLSIIAYQMIYMMYKRIDKNRLLEKLKKIKKLEEPQLFVNPKIIKIKDFNEILIKFLIDFYSYCEKNKLYNSFYDIFIPFLSFYYYYDTNNKLQIMIQELLCNRKSKYIKGGERDYEHDNEYDYGNNEESYSHERNNQSYENEINEDIFSDKNIEDVLKEFEEIEKKLDKNTNLLDDNDSLKQDIDSLFKTTLPDSTEYKFDYQTYSTTNDNINKMIEEIEKKESIDSSSYSTLVELRGKIEDKKTVIKRRFISNLDENQEDSNKLIMHDTYIINPKENFKKFFEEIRNSPDFEFQSLNRIKTKNNESSILDLIDKCNSETEKKLSQYYKEIKNFYEILVGHEQHINSLISEKKENDKRQRYSQQQNQGHGSGSFSGGKYIFKGGAADMTQFKKLKETIKSVKEDLNRYKGNKKASSNTERKLISKEIIDKNDYNIFDNLLKSYDDDVKKGVPVQITDDLFYNKVRANNLDPAEELKVTFNDKLVFIGVAYILRLISTYLTYYMINTNRATTLTNTLFYYVIWYIIVFVITVFIINFDTFYLRIFVNYLNMHINTLGITTHLFLVVVFVYIVYLLIVNINGIERPRTRLNDTEKIKLKYKFDLLTMIVFVFVCLLTLII